MLAYAVGLLSLRTENPTLMQRAHSIWIIFFVVFLDLLGFGIVLPLMPLYAADTRFQATPAEIGWLMAVYSLMQFFFAPLWGKLSDRIGRRPVLIIGLFGSSLSYVVYGLAQTLTVLFLARGMAGIMGANIAAAQAAMADITPREERAKAMGLIGAAFGLGFILGPALGGALSGYGLEVAPLAAAAITGLNGVAALFLLKETRSVTTQEKTGPAIHSLFGASWRLAQASPGALKTCLLMGLYTALFAAFEVTLPLWGHTFLGWTLTSIGWVFSYVGIVAVLVQGGLVRRLVAKKGEKSTSILGLWLIASGMVFFALDGLTLALAALALIAAGSGLVHPGFSSLVSLNSDTKQQGLMLGLFQSMSALGRGVGPVLGGLLYGSLEGMVFPLIASGLFLTLLMFFIVKKQLKDSQQ